MPDNFIIDRDHEPDCDLGWITESNLAVAYIDGVGYVEMTCDDCLAVGWWRLSRFEEAIDRDAATARLRTKAAS